MLPALDFEPACHGRSGISYLRDISSVSAMYGRSTYLDIRELHKTNRSSVHFSKPDNRPNSSQFGNPASIRANLPPSPPMSSEASFEGYRSPSSKPASQSQGSSNYYYETTPPLSQHEADSRQMATAAPRAPVQYPSSAGYSSQSGMNPYYPPMQPTPPPQQQMSGLYYQRPLPQVRTISQIQQMKVI